MNTEQNKNLNYNKIINIAFIALAVLLTVIALMFVWINIGQPFKIGSVNEMKDATYENYKTKKGIKNEDNETIYYLYIYSTAYKQDDWYDDIVVEYANYARTHSTATPIYAYNYDIEGNEKILSDLGSSTKLGTDIPGLVLIKNGNISTKYFTWTKLSNELTSAMNK